MVVLAERDKEEMETDIAKFEFDLMGTSVICRSGSALILADLKKVKFLKHKLQQVFLGGETSDSETFDRFQFQMRVLSLCLDLMKTLIRLFLALSITMVIL